MSNSERVCKAIIGLYGLLAVFLGIFSLIGFEVAFLPFFVLILVGIILFALAAIFSIVYVCVQQIYEAFRGY